MKDKFSLENRFNIYVIKEIIKEYKRGVATIDLKAGKVYNYYQGTIDIYPKEVEYLKNFLEQEQ